ATRQTKTGGSRRQIAVVPTHLGLAIEIKAVVRVPGQRAAETVAGAADRAVAENGGNIGGYGSILAGDSADQATGFSIVKRTVDAGLQLPDIDIILSAACGGFGREIAVCG